MNDSAVTKVSNSIRRNSQRMFLGEGKGHSLVHWCKEMQTKSKGNQ